MTVLFWEIFDCFSAYAISPARLMNSIIKKNKMSQEIILGNFASVQTKQSFHTAMSEPSDVSQKSGQSFVHKNGEDRCFFCENAIGSKMPLCEGERI